MEGARPEDGMPALEHASTPGQQVVEQKEVFDGILRYLRQIDASLSKASPMEKTQEKSDNTEVPEAKRLREKSATGVEAKQLERFFDGVRVWDTEEMISMIKKEPRLMLETSTWGEAVCTVFQLAVLLNSDEMVAKMLRIAIRKYGPSPRELFGVVKMDGFDMSALDIALVRGNKCIAELLQDADRGRYINFDEIRYRPGLEEKEKQDVLALLRPILNGDFDAVFKGDSEAQKWLEHRSKEGLPTGTIREIIQQGCDEYLVSWSPTKVDSFWWGTHYGISLRGDEDSLFVLHKIADRFYLKMEYGFSFWKEVLEMICRALGPTYTTCLLNLTDHHGKTPVHCSIDLGTSNSLKDFICLVGEYCDPSFNLFNIRDLAGRTCLHTATIQGRADLVETMARIDGDRFRAVLEASYGSEYTTAFHLAIMHNYNECLKVLVKCGCDTNKPSKHVKIAFNNQQVTKYDKIGRAFQMAAMEGHAKIMQTLLEDDKLWDKGMIHRPSERDDSQIVACDTPALHLAAHSGSPLAVKVLLDSGKFDLFAVDGNGDTALHSLAGWELQKQYMGTSDIDFADPLHYYRSKSEDPDVQKKKLAGIIACIELLIQAGLKMNHLNKREVAPQLIPSASAELTRWWYDKLATQNQEARSNLAAATSAVSVTAALVATASFVGPLQPPLGLSPSTDAWLTGYSQVNHNAVQVFLICDSLSFYLAISSIMMAVIPSLFTVPYEPFFVEMRIANRFVQVAGALLFASIPFVICAFSAASIAVVPESGWHYTLAVVLTIVGALICFTILCLFHLRFMRLISPHVKSPFSKALLKL